MNGRQFTAYQCVTMFFFVLSAYIVYCEVRQNIVYGA